MTIRFEWDDEKAHWNLRKHAVSFAEAQTVFDDPLGRVANDPDHSADEDRSILVGFSERNRLLLISFLHRGDVIRTISARAATVRERKRHEEESR